MTCIDAPFIDGVVVCVVEVMSFLPATVYCLCLLVCAVHVVGNWAPDVQCCPEPPGLPTGTHSLIVGCVVHGSIGGSSIVLKLVCS